MTTGSLLPWRERSAAALAAALVTLALGLLIAIGLRVVLLPERHEWAPLSTFEVAPPPPPPPTLPPPPARPVKQTAPPPAFSPSPRAAAPAPRAAPPTQTILPTAEPLRPVTEISASGAGTAADGAGTATAGNGAGGAGRGSGGGGDSGGRRARQLDGFITLADYPAAVRKAHAQGTAGVRYTVQANGRVGDCAIVASTGNAKLDQLTCRLIVRRFVFRPALDRDGRTVAESRSDRFIWRMVD